MSEMTQRDDRDETGDPSVPHTVPSSPSFL